MKLIQINHNPSRRDLNLFGVTWLVFFAAVGGLVLKHGGSLPAAAAVWGLAAAVAAVGSLAPALMRIVYLGTAYAASPIGFAVSYLVLIVVYYLVLTPVGLVMRLVGYDPLNRRFDHDADTYWSSREQEHDLNRYFRQF